MTPRTFTVWHRPRGTKKWVKQGEYADIRDAAGVVLDGPEKHGGAWTAIRTGIDPDAPDDDDE